MVAIKYDAALLQTHVVRMILIFCYSIDIAESYRTGNILAMIEICLRNVDNGSPWSENSRVRTLSSQRATEALRLATVGQIQPFAPRLLRQRYTMS